MTGTVTGLFTHKYSQSYLNHLVIMICNKPTNAYAHQCRFGSLLRSVIRCNGSFGPLIKHKFSVSLQLIGGGGGSLN